MNQREIRDEKGITWTCVQAYAGAQGENAQQAKQLTQDKNQEVPVVCTPSGGEQTVRIMAPTDWIKKLSDQDLVKAIASAKG